MNVVDRYRAWLNVAYDMARHGATFYARPPHANWCHLKPRQWAQQQAMAEAQPHMLEGWTLLCLTPLELEGVNG